MIWRTQKEKKDFIKIIGLSLFIYMGVRDLKLHGDFFYFWKKNN